MNIVIIGSGKVATWFGRVLKSDQYKIVQVYSRNINHANALAVELNSSGINDLTQINTEADLYIIAVSDNAFNEIAHKLPPLNAVVVNTSGSLNISALKKTSLHYGVIWPMISVHKNMNEKNDFVMVVEASDEQTLKTIKNISSSFTDRIITLTYEQRQILHLSAVFANNFSNHMIAIAQQLMIENKIETNILQPLLENMVNQLRNKDANGIQTGPALRNDTLIIEQHMQLLKEKPELQKLYQIISESISRVNKNLK